MSTAAPERHPPQSRRAAPQPALHEPAAHSSRSGTASMHTASPAWADSSRQLTQSSQIAQLQTHTPPNAALTQGGLPEGLRSGIESLSGVDMSGVRVHRNSAKPTALRADAYAQGQDIHLGAGQEKHLPHEAWHVAQQALGRVQPTLQMAQGVAVNDDARLEREADVMGQRAMAMGASRSQAAAPHPDFSVKASGSQAPVQRHITVNGVPYTTQVDFKTLIGLIGSDRMKQLGTTSKKLLAWVITPGPQGNKTGTFTDVDELFDTLQGTRQKGLDAQRIGEEREAKAGGSAGSSSHGRKRGDVISENNGVQLCAGYGSQDPYLSYKGSVLQLDTETDQVWGLVGGPAKARDDKAVDTELNRLSVLVKCCKADGRHEAVVRYNDIKDPQETKFARLVQGALARGVTVYVNGEQQHSGPSTARRVGQVVGGLGGVYGGFQLGATLGSSLGPLGTVLGGVIGGIGGYYLGGAVGEQIGKRL